MFVRVVSDAISLQSNSAVLHHWIDFLLITIPQFRLSLFTVIFPLIDCLVTRIRALVQDFKLAYSSSTLGVFSAEATDAEYTVLMNALERLLLMAISESLSAAFEEESKGSDKVMDSPSVGTPGGLGLLGYMSGVLGTTDSESPAVLDESKVRLHPLYQGGCVLTPGVAASSYAESTARCDQLASLLLGRQLEP